MVKILFLTFFFIFIASTFAQMHMLIFKEFNQLGPATRVNSEGVCMNFFQYFSGRTGGAYTCRVWSQMNCQRGAGTAMEVTSTGRNFWAGGAWSMMC
jgi:hypothetical protein